MLCFQKPVHFTDRIEVKTLKSILNMPKWAQNLLLLGALSVGGLTVVATEAVAAAGPGHFNHAGYRTGGVVVCLWDYNSTVNVRSGPGTSNSVLRVMQSGDWLTLTGEAHYDTSGYVWRKVRYWVNGRARFGWLRGDYLCR